MFSWQFLHPKIPRVLGGGGGSILCFSYFSSSVIFFSGYYTLKCSGFSFYVFFPGRQGRGRKEEGNTEKKLSLSSSSQSFHFVPQFFSGPLYSAYTCFVHMLRNLNYEFMYLFILLRQCLPRKKLPKPYHQLLTSSTKYPRFKCCHRISQVGTSFCFWKYNRGK